MKFLVWMEGAYSGSVTNVIADGEVAAVRHCSKRFANSITGETQPVWCVCVDPEKDIDPGDTPPQGWPVDDTPTDFRRYLASADGRDVEGPLVRLGPANGPRFVAVSVSGDDPAMVARVAATTARVFGALCETEGKHIGNEVDERDYDSKDADAVVAPREHVFVVERIHHEDPRTDTAAYVAGVKQGEPMVSPRQGFALDMCGATLEEALDAIRKDAALNPSYDYFIWRKRPR